MGATLSLLSSYNDISEVPPLTREAVQLILMKLPTSVLISNALRVSKVWNQIGRRNVIWKKRYFELRKRVDGVDVSKDYDASDYHEYEVFELFKQAWASCMHVWLDKSGNVKRISKWSLSLKKEPVLFIQNENNIQYFNTENLKDSIDFAFIASGDTIFSFNSKLHVPGNVITKHNPNNFKVDFGLNNLMVPITVPNEFVRKIRNESVWIFTKNSESEFKAKFLTFSSVTGLSRIDEEAIVPILIHDELTHSLDLLACSICENKANYYCSANCKREMYCSYECAEVHYSEHEKKCK